MKKKWCLAVFVLVFISTATPITLNTGAQLEGWSEDVRLTFTENRSLTPSIAMWEKNIHVVWSEADEGDDSCLWCINSYDAGDTWSIPKCLMNITSIGVITPKIAVNGSNIHVIWVGNHDKRLYYIGSPNNGNSWNTECILTSNIYYKNINWDIGVHEDFVHVTYVDLNNKLTYIQSNDNGNSWSAPNILVPTNSKALISAIDVYGSYVHIAWCDVIRAGYPNDDIYYIKSEDNGMTWEPDINITATPMNRNHWLDISADDGNIYVVYSHEEEKARQVYFGYSEDNGITWVKNIKLSNSTTNILHPVIAAKGRKIFVAWTDQLQLIFKTSYDGGEIWSADMRLTIDNKRAYLPDIAVNNQSAHIVWMDYRDLNEEIYYKRFSIHKQPVEATIDINPDTLNLKSKGRWITAYIELANSYNINDINISSILMENCISAEHHPYEIGDYDNDGIPDLMVKFDRSELEDILPVGDSIILTIIGNFFDDRSFKGNDSIRVI